MGRLLINLGIIFKLYIYMYIKDNLFNYKINNYFYSKNFNIDLKISLILVIKIMKMI